MTRKKETDLDVESIKDAKRLIDAGYKAIRKKDLTAMNEWNSKLEAYIQREAKRKRMRKESAKRAG